MTKLSEIELLKFLAAVMITNSHFKPLYPDSLQALGTLGAPGNALFFFVSGFVLILGRQDVFSTWYKRRITRIWPTILVWSSLLYPIIFSKRISVSSIWLAGNYWFIHCIAIYYLIFWFIRRYASTHFKKFAIWGVVVSIVYFLFMMDMVTPLSIYQEDLHYICFFSIMMMGSYIASNRDSIIGSSLCRDLALCIGSLLLFYVIQSVGKSQTDWRYYFQILSLLPLHSFIWYLYLVTVNSKVKSLLQDRILGTSVRFVASLTLEIYMVAFVLIITSLNSLFPLNLIIVFIFILSLAYVLKICTNFLMQTLSDAPYDWKRMCIII